LDLHLLFWQVVSVGISILDELAAVLLDLVEVVRAESTLIRDNIECLKILHDVLDELNLLGGGVGIVEAQDHFSFVHLSIMIVEH